MTYSNALSLASHKLKDIDSGNFISLSLLAHVVHKPSTYVWAHPELDLTVAQMQCFAGLIDRAFEHEPLAYLLGYTEFYGLNFMVDRRVLIPRPETEALVDLALGYINSSKLETDNLHLVEVGTGSGCLAISLAKRLPKAKIIAIDASSEALEVAQSNAKALKATQVNFMLGSLLTPLAGHLEPHCVDVIVANLPYISDAEFDHLPATVRNYEPVVALKSGRTADALNKQLVKQAKQWLKPAGLLAYETTNGRIVVDSSRTK